MSAAQTPQDAATLVNNARRRVKDVYRWSRPGQSRLALAAAFRDLTIAGKALGMYLAEESEDP